VKHETEVVALSGSPQDDQQRTFNSSPPPLPPPLPAAADAYALLVDWHYEQNGKLAGPLTAHDVEEQIQAGRITRDAFFWHPALTNWVPANSTPFVSLLGGPSPLAGSLNSGWAWALAFAPILSVQLIQFIAVIIIATTPDVNPFNYYTHLERITLGLWWIYIALYVLFSLMDTNHVRKAGHDSPRGWLAKVFLPAYLYSRSKKLGQNQTLLMVWVVALIATVFS
jgi:hypothetical protein